MNTLRDMFDSLKNNDRGIYFIKGDKEESYLSYKKLYDNSSSILAKLQEHGLKSNQELVFQIDDEEEFISTFWACVLGGIIAVPIPVCKNSQDINRLKNVVTKLNNPVIYVGENQKEYLIDLIKQESQEVLHLIEERMFLLKNYDKVKKFDLPKITPEDTVMIQFSSGSTGEPKGVELSSSNILSYTSATYVAINGPSVKRSLSWMPLTHNFGLIGLHITSLIFGIDQYIMPTKLFLVNPLLWMIKASEKKISLTASPNFGYMHFLRAFGKTNGLELDLSSIDVILNGAEPVNHDICKKFIEVLSNYGLSENSIIPAYGMAEATLGITISTMKEKYNNYDLDRNFLTIGKKIKEVTDINDNNKISLVEAGKVLDNCTLRICDDLGKKLPEDTVGHIQIKGPSVMKGYYNDKVRTEKAFTKDSWLITGDVGFLRDNKLVITGRAKEIIFINGKNYYPSDFERVLENLKEPLITTVSVVGKFNDEIQTEEVLVFIETKEETKKYGDVISKIKKQINLYMGIDVKNIIFLDEMPRTSGGKIQRFKLLEMFNTGSIKPYILKDISKENIDIIDIIVPKEIEDEVECIVMDVLYEILSIKYISQNDNLIEIGMDSLRAGMIISELNKRLQVNLEIKTLFKHKTIKGVINEIRRMDKTKYKSIEKTKKLQYYPLSSQQKRLYTLNRIDPNGTSYNISAGIHLYGEIDIEKFIDVFNIIVSRHEALRTSFKLIDGTPSQIINDKVKFNVNYQKLSREDAENYKKNFISPFNLEKAPLMKITLVKIEDVKEYLLLLDMHHIISDGTSMGLIVKEFCSLYEGLELPKTKLQYRDYTMWQNKEMKDNGYEVQKNYWKNILSDELPLLEMPLDYERGTVQSFEGEQVKVNVGTKLAESLYDIALENEMTLYMVLIGAYSVLLSKYTMQEDILIGSPISGRSHPDFDSTVGMFVNTFVLRAKPASDMSFIDFLKEIKEKTFEAYENQDYQFEWILKDISYRKKAGRNPLFDVMFNMQNMYIPEIKLKNLRCVPCELENKTTKFDLSLAVNEKERDIILSFIYCTKLFKSETIEKLSEHFINLLNCVTKDINIKINEITILSDEELKKYKVIDKKNKDEIKLDFNF